MSIWSKYAIDDQEYVKKVLGEYYDLITKDEDVKFEVHLGSGSPVTMLNCDLDIVLKKILELEGKVDDQ